MRTWQDKNSDLYDGLPYMAIRGDSISLPTVVEIKLDGELQYVIKKKGQVYLANKKEHGRLRTDMPVTNSIVCPDNTVFLAELVYGNGTNFYDFSRHKLDPDLNLALFGCLRYDGEDIWKNYNYVWARKLLESQTFYNEKVCLIPNKICRTQDEIDAFFNKVVAGGYEGIVAKSPLSVYFNGESKDWTKRKNVADNEFVIIGFQSGTKRAKTLSILVGHRLDGKIERLTYVGGGFKAWEKVDILNKLLGMVTGSDGKGEQYVRPEIVVTVEHYGVIRNADGSVNSLRHPQFKCIREDKTVEQIDTIK